MSEPLEDFGARVRERRLEKSLTQDQLAERLGVSRTYLSHIEGGRAQNLSFRLATALTAELGIETPATDQVLDSIPASLQRYADAHGLSPDDVQTLAAVQYRGKRPDTEKDWSILHQVIRLTIGEQGGANG